MFDTALQIISFALGVAGFVASLLPRRSAKAKIRSAALMAGLVAFAVTGLALIWESHERSSHIRAVSEQVIDTLGKEAKSIDQLHEALAYENLRTVSDAVALLVDTKKVGHRVVNVRDNANLQYRARLFFVK
ncbi:MAG: hypothetical protein KZQ81_15810 [Candidatus Thiodiazotropha sp. (ex Rostrolucina anterorostrata)]|nr:hypothetical protein [Candidatus Thiodiazotropha sp. (ex Rostrolucina anterorostrata)]